MWNLPGSTFTRGLWNAPLSFQWVVVLRSSGRSLSAVPWPNLPRLERTHTYGQLYLAYAPTRNSVCSGLSWWLLPTTAGLAGGMCCVVLPNVTLHVRPAPPHHESSRAGVHRVSAASPPRVKVLDDTTCER